MAVICGAFNAKINEAGVEEYIRLPPRATLDDLTPINYGKSQSKVSG